MKFTISGLPRSTIPIPNEYVTDVVFGSDSPFTKLVLDLTMRGVVVLIALLSSSVVKAFFPGRAPGFRYPLPWPLGASLAEKVLKNPKWPPTWPYSEADFARMASGLPRKIGFSSKEPSSHALF